MQLSSKTLAAIFGDSNEFCGKEDVIHAIIHHQLIESGLSPFQVAREQKITKNAIDIVIFKDNIQGQFQKTTILPALAIEVKGGAYGNRNALRDVIDSEGFCTDLPKLEMEVKKGVAAWFICVDMPELGRGVSIPVINKIHQQCKKRNISFAYFCQGEDKFYYAPIGSTQSNIAIQKSKTNGCKKAVSSVISKNNQHFKNMCNDLLKINAHEANTVAALYRLFRESDFPVRQLSLETYFSFAKKPGSRMHDRPDMVLFDESHDGSFNLYKGGNVGLSNDAHKMAHIKTIFEVKGSASMNTKGEKVRLKIYLDDIIKLKGWQKMAAANGCKSLEAYFICLDRHRTPLSRSSLDEMRKQSGKNKVVYISNNGVEIF